MRGWLFAVLVAGVLSAGCGSSVPEPTEADVESYVKQRIGDQLFNSMMALEGGHAVEVMRAAGRYEPATVDARGNFQPGSGGFPPPGGRRPAGNVPPPVALREVFLRRARRSTTAIRPEPISTRWTGKSPIRNSNLSRRSPS